MGVDLAAIDMDYLESYLTSNIDKLRGNYICVSNVHTTVMSYKDSEYRDIQNHSALSIPDGGPLTSVGRKRGFVKMKRTAGPDLMKLLFENCGKYPLRHCFYGSTEETLDKLKKELANKYPELKISGMFSPPFRELSCAEDGSFVSAINSSHPDIVWVGLGAPKQERWMAAHEHRINAVMIGVGAGFDYFAGNIKRAPKWMQKTDLEWAYRLMQDPKRLLRRYLTTNLSFIWNAVLKGR